MLYDFHIHTREYSDCSISSAEEMCLKAVEAGLSGIALTEHDVWWPLTDIQELQHRFPQLTIMRGIEYSCPEGHFLVFLPDPGNGKPFWLALCARSNPACSPSWRHRHLGPSFSL